MKKWLREASCIPNYILQPISDQRYRLALDIQVTDLFLIPNDDHRTRSTHIILYRQFADLFLIQNENIKLFICIQLLHVWSVLDILTWNKHELEEKFI